MRGRGRYLKRGAALLLACFCAVSLGGCASRYELVKRTPAGQNEVELECMRYADLCARLGLPSLSLPVRDADGTLTAEDILVFRCVSEFFKGGLICVFDIYQRHTNLRDCERILYIREYGYTESEPYGEVKDGVQLARSEYALQSEASAILSPDEYEALCAYLTQESFAEQPTVKGESGMDGYSVRIQQGMHLVSRWCPDEDSTSWTVYGMLQDMADRHGLAYTRLVMRDGSSAVDTTE